MVKRGVPRRMFFATDVRPRVGGFIFGASGDFLPVR